MEEHTAALAEWVETAVDAHAVQLLQAAAVELQDLEAGRDVPDVDEGDVGELAAPLHGQADTAEQGHDHVAQALAALEALVGVAPHAVNGVDALGLSQHIFEGHLDVTVDAVGVAVDKIQVSHDGGLVRDDGRTKVTSVCFRLREPNGRAFRVVK